ncbi:MAG TPA: 1,4-dihydroxy-2-naphthoate polyprenyltransferase [Opitutaceae bacterium]|nr:1,4-dihydroxy-2-naphthoate polyprenyltransferase [Opitutaceae bacterium]
MSGPERSPERWRVWLEAARPRTLPAALAPVLVGSALAAHDGAFRGGAALLCLGFALLIQIGTNFANDYYDFVHGADHAGRVGPVRAVAAGLVAPPLMRRAMWLTFAAAFLLGLGLLARGGPWLLAVGVASILSGIAYTGGPYPLGYHGLGDLFVFLFFGLVAVAATYFVQAGRISAHALPAAAAIGLLASNILVVNNYRDYDSDAAAGKRTLVVRFGRRFARAQYAISAAAALAAPLLYLSLGYKAWCLLPCLLAPLAWSLVRRLRPEAPPRRLIALLGETGGFLALYAGLFALGCLL